MNEAIAPEVDGRVRTIRRLLIGGTLVIGGGLAFLVAIGGSGGRASFAGLLLGAAASAVLTVVYGASVSLIDEMRDQHISRERIVWIGAALIGAILLPGMLVGIGG